YRRRAWPIQDSRERYQGREMLGKPSTCGRTQFIWCTMSGSKCELCGEPMTPGEEMFKYHGYSGPCAKPVVLNSAEGDWVSAGRLREIWAECGGLIDERVRPYVENTTLLVQVLRNIINEA